MPTDEQLAVLVREVEDLCFTAHAALIQMDTKVGELRKAVTDREWEQTQQRVTERLLEVVPDSRHHEVALGVVS